MVKRRRLQYIFSNLLSKWKVSSEGGKVGIKLFGHLVGTYRGGGGRLDTNFKGIGSYSCFWSPFSFTNGRKSNWDFKSDQLLDGIFIDKSNAEERVNLSPCQFQNWIGDKFVHQNSVFFWTTLSLCKHKVRKALLIAGWEKLFTFQLQCEKE